MEDDLIAVSAEEERILRAKVEEAERSPALAESAGAMRKADVVQVVCLSMHDPGPEMRLKVFTVMRRMANGNGHGQ